MKKLKMQIRDVVDGNIKKIFTLFMQCITEHL